MRKNIYFLFATLAVAVFTMGLSGCGNSSKKELNRLLVKLADSDATIDNNDWKQICDYLDANKASLKDFYQQDNIDVEQVKAYISDLFANRRPAKEITFVGIGQAKTLNVKFYLERSGSMTPYDSPQGDGSFKAAIVKMLNNLPGSNESHKIYVVNSAITPYPKGFQSFISDTNIFEATKGYGDPSYTDFGKIFDDLLNKTGEKELSILVTDMIYSTKSMQGVNPQKVFAEAQGMTNAVFKSEVKKKAMLIVKMNGSYNGPYYTYNSPSAGTTYNGHRPYYIIVVGSNANIARLTMDKDYQPFARFAELKGYENLYLFQTEAEYAPYHSFLLRNDDIRGRFEPERGQAKQITNLHNIKADPNSGDVRLALAVDLSGMLIDKDYLTNPSNYAVNSEDEVAIKEIKPISTKDATPAEKRYIGTATHLFILAAKNISHEQNVDIMLMNRLPAWVENSSSDDDANMASANFANTTFGLKYLLKGIYDSYTKNSNGKPYYFDLKLKLKD